MHSLFQCATIFNGQQVLDLTVVGSSFLGPAFHCFLLMCGESLGMILDSCQNITLVLPEENITSLQLMLASLLISGGNVPWVGIHCTHAYN